MKLPWRRKPAVYPGRKISAAIDMRERPEVERQQEEIHVVMTRRAAHELTRAISLAEARIIPDYNEPIDSRTEEAGEWLRWACGRIAIAEDAADAPADTVAGGPIQ